MFDVLKTLSSLVKNKQSSVSGKVQSKPVTEVKQAEKPAPQQPQKVVPKIDEEALRQAELQIKMAETKVKEMLYEAKEEAFRIRTQADTEARRKTETIDRREGAVEEREKRVGEKISEL